ncbi:hypothetical protein BN903_30 [Halorubrum sp. AJ67]|nr:hypothetical protein BN903_30 [Halorubrum sp. AJ67]
MGAEEAVEKNAYAGSHTNYSLYVDEPEPMPEPTGDIPTKDVDYTVIRNCPVYGAEIPILWL